MWHEGITVGANSGSEFWKRLWGELPFTPPYFFPLECVVLREMLQSLCASSRETCERQIAQFNLVQRGGWWERLIFYRRRFRKNVMPAALLLPIDDGDVKIARLKFEVNGEEFNAVLHAYNRRLLNINFAPGYKHVRYASSIHVLKSSALLRTAKESR
jgi:hypothetical protein